MFVFIAALAVLLQQEPSRGTIEGNIVNLGTNAPISGVRIKASRSQDSMEAITDNTGRFVLRNVPPGLVGIEASAEGHMFALRLSGSSLPVGTHNLLSINGVLYPRLNLVFSVTLAPGENLKLPPILAVSGALLRGRVIDSEGRGVAGATVGFSAAISGGPTGSPLLAEVSSTRTDEQGEYRSATLSPGAYYVKATMDRPNAARLTVFYPATIDERSAAPVILTDGAEMIADVAIPASTEENVFRVSGRVLPLPGNSTVPLVGLLLKTQELRSSIALDGASEEGTGRFELRGIYPGTYDLFASVNIDDKEYLGKIPVEIRGRDVEELEITLQPSADIRGRFVLDRDAGGQQLARPAKDTIRLALNRRDGLFGNILKPETDESGEAFSFKDVPPGNYDLTVTFLSDLDPTRGRDLYLADVRAGGRSVLESGLEVGVDPSDSLEVVFGANGGSVSGGIRSPGAKLPAVVFMVPDPAGRRNASLVRSANVTSDGHFEISALAPGVYRVFAVVSGTPLSRRDFVSRYEARAVAIVVRRGAQTAGVEVPLLATEQ